MRCWRLEFPLRQAQRAAAAGFFASFHAIVRGKIDSCVHPGFANPWFFTVLAPSRRSNLAVKRDWPIGGSFIVSREFLFFAFCSGSLSVSPLPSTLGG